ncbi:hypothetical protein [Bacillus sp. NEB1478]|uniref:hypothetical protein n=1 Tax=Bacillus sp. NEB1478 TaxID=3073816 RepID=UPI0028738957|nr:hypothetical protein [Bacillus sp. NEB1478]WNB91050.1 hypothetical protein RGB74_14195 [Bacillus sp. NEB1478]
MKKKFYLYGLLICIVLGLGIYSYISSVAICGTSDNGVWKASYQKNFDKGVGGWIGHVKQTSEDKIKLKEIRFTDNEKTLMSDHIFIDERMEDGSVTKLNPVSIDFYLGDPPKENHKYKLHITWEKKGKLHTDIFQLK